MATTTRQHARTDLLAADQKLIDGTQQFLTHYFSLTIGSQNVTAADIVKVLTDRIATGKAVVSASDARTAAVKADRDERTKTAKFVNNLRRVVVGMFAESPDTLGVFGLAPPKVGKKTAATKADAAAKLVATRKARHTMGSKQKKPIHGTAPSAGTGSAASPPEPGAGSGSSGATPTSGAGSGTTPAKSTAQS